MDEEKNIRKPKLYDIGFLFVGVSGGIYLGHYWDFSYQLQLPFLIIGAIIWGIAKQKESIKKQ
ncbi:MAG: hypothetical protein ABH851_00010 [Methanobacteriota archaeon]